MLQDMRQDHLEELKNFDKIIRQAYKIIRLCHNSTFL